MFRLSYALVLASFLAAPASGETVTRVEFLKEHNGYPCMSTLFSNEGKEVSVQLSDYKDVWSLQFNVSDRAEIYKKFFDGRGILDLSSFEDQFDAILIGGRLLPLNEVFLLDVRLQDLNEKSTGKFEIRAKHNVANALQAMSEDGLEIENLIALDGTSEFLAEFLSCSYSAMGLNFGESVATDYRVEYRLIFESSFKRWVSSMARADQCLVTPFDDALIAETIDAAADAFFPGVFGAMQRKQYRETLSSILPGAKLSGTAEAVANGCMMAGSLAEVSKMPVDKAIQAALELE